MNERKRKFDISILGRAQFRSSDRRGAEAGALPLPAAAAVLLQSFKALPRKPLLVSEIAVAVDRPADTCVESVIDLVKAGSLDLLQRADGGNHLVALTAAGRAQLEIM